jgi:hypothetical protein
MATAIDSISRRAFLAAAGGAVCALAAPRLAAAGERLIERLIVQARSYPAISQRIDVISRALLGHRYQADTLIGGPRKAEIFVARDDRFDCVTFCETVLAAAKAHDLPSFEAELRAIRYHNGVVNWRERNHDFAAWCERNTAAGLCRPVSLGDPVEVRKRLDTPRALGRRDYLIAAIPSAEILAKQAMLERGDIIGFVSRRSWLDYFHTGFVMFDGGGTLMLRNASQSRGRVVDQPMQQFLKINGVRYVTIVRPQGGEEAS